jgi:hypothetical protein
MLRNSTCSKSYLIDVCCISLFPGVKDDEGGSRTRSRDSKDREDSKSSVVSDTPSVNVSETPSGVNRRSAVLFGKKPQKRSRKDSEDHTGDDQTPNKKGPGRPNKSKTNTASVDSPVESSASGASNVDKKSSDDKTVAPSSGSSRKRANSSTNVSQDVSDSSQTSSKRPVSLSSTQISTTIADGPSLFSHSRRESFLQYRNFSQSQSDVDSSSESGSTDSSLSDLESSSKASSSDNEDGSSKRYSRRGECGIKDNILVQTHIIHLSVSYHSRIR